MVILGIVAFAIILCALGGSTMSSGTKKHCETICRNCPFFVGGGRGDCPNR